MKRIVQCPKCQAKLSVVDLGKPIKQKCPKCNENFVIESDEIKSVDAKKEPATEAAAAPAKAEATPSAAPAVKAEAPAEPKASADAKADAKPEAKAEPKAEPKPEAKAEPKADVKPEAAPKPAPRPAAPRPAPVAAPEPDLPLPHSGVSFLHIVVIIGLLILVIVMQAMAKKNAERRFNGLEAQITEMHKALSNQIIKSR